MTGHKQRKLQKQMKRMFDTIDDYLEEKYGMNYPLHPNRPARGRTANKEADGLFNVGAAFSTGFGTKYGRGYILDIKMSTLSNVPNQIREKITEEVIEQVNRKLPEYFPDRKLEISKDGNIFKIHGDFSLGNVY